jgi:hypothetical protein
MIFIFFFFGMPLSIPCLFSIIYPIPFHLSYSFPSFYSCQVCGDIPVYPPNALIRAISFSYLHAGGTFTTLLARLWFASPSHWLCSLLPHLILTTLPLNVVVVWLTFLLRIQEVLVSHLCPNNDYPC